MTKKEQILLAAQECFSETGFAGTPLKAIADRAGVAFGLVAHHFGKKEDLFYAAAFDLIDSLLQEIGTAMDEADTGLDAVRGFFKAYFRFTEEHRASFPVVLQCSPFSDMSSLKNRDVIAGKFGKLIDGLKECLERGHADGSIREVPVERTAFILYGNIVGAVRTALLSTYQVDKLFDATLEFVTAALENR